MAVAFDAVTTAAVPSGTTASLTFSHTDGSGSDRCLTVVVTQWASTITGVPSGVTYAGVALTKVSDSGRGSAGDCVTIWRLVAPATGANNVVVTWTVPLDKQGRANAVTFTGVDQTTPDGTGATATGTSTAPSATQTTTSGDWIVDGVANDATGAPTLTMSAVSGRVERWNAVSGGERCGGSTHSAPSTSQACAWTLSASKTWAVAALNLHPVGAAAAAVGPYYYRFVGGTGA